MQRWNQAFGQVKVFEKFEKPGIFASALQLSSIGESESEIVADFELKQQVELVSPVANKMRIEVVDYQEWTVDDTVQWLSCMYDESFVTMDTRFAKAALSNTVNGLKLATKSDQELMNLLSVNTDFCQRKLTRDLAKLRKNRSKSW